MHFGDNIHFVTRISLFPFEKTDKSSVGDIWEFVQLIQLCVYADYSHIQVKMTLK